MKKKTKDYEEMLNRGYRYALSLTHSKSKAEDLVQDAWVNILRAGGDRNIGYFFTTIKNRYIDDYRKKKLQLVEDIDELSPAENLETSLENQLIERLDLADGQLADALGKIKDEEREVLYLMCVEEYTASETAEITSRPRGTVLSLMHRTKKKLQKILSSDGSMKRGSI